MKHKLPIRIYYEDTDAGGVVYHARYVNFGERGRTEFLRSIGLNLHDIINNYELMFVIRHIEIDYMAPAVLDDLLTLETSITEIRNSAFVMKQTFFRPIEKEPSKHQIICELNVTVVCVNTNNFKAVRIPDSLKSEFLNTMKD